MVLRSLSQTGFPRLAKNASQRRILEGGAPAKRTVLDAFNDKAEGRYLHPTKGWRRLNARRSVAQLITAEMKRGTHWSLSAMRKMLKSVPR
jgi:hypothetical protein